MTLSLNNNTNTLYNRKDSYSENTISCDSAFPSSHCPLTPYLKFSRPLRLLGSTHLVFKDGQHYTWSKVTITVHNIIVGRLWAENHGDAVIKNHATNHTCHMHYDAHSYFSRDSDRRVSLAIFPRKGLKDVFGKLEA